MAVRGGLDAKYNAVLQALQQGDGARAEALLLPLIKKFPNADGLLDALGSAQWLQNRPDEAIKTWLDAHYREPRSATIAVNLAEALIHRGKNEQAERVVRRALQSQQGNTSLLSILGRILLATNRPFEAVEAHAAAARRDSKNPLLWRAVLHAAEQAGDDVAAREAGETLMVISPTPHVARSLVGSHCRLGRADLAAEVLVNASQRWPSDPTVDAARADFTLAAGETGDAMTALERAARAYPACAVIHAELLSDTARLELLATRRETRHAAEKAHARLLVRSGRVGDGLRAALNANTAFAPDLKIDSGPWLESYKIIAAAAGAMAGRRRQIGGAVRPVLLLGWPRCGSTLAARLLFDQGLSSAGETMAARKHARRFKTPPSWPTATDAALADFAEAYGLDLLDAAGMPDLSSGPRWIIDRTLWNIEFLPLLLAAPLGARTVLVEREWRATALSILTQDPPVKRPHDLSLTALGTALAAYTFLADRMDAAGLIDHRLRLTTLQDTPTAAIKPIVEALDPPPLQSNASRANAPQARFLAPPALLGQAHRPPTRSRPIRPDDVDGLLRPVRDAFAAAASILGIPVGRLDRWGTTPDATGGDERPEDG